MSGFERLYWPSLRDRLGFGDSYDPPKTFPHGEWVTVAKFVPDSGDGQRVEIDEARYPARFFRLRVLPGTSSAGADLPGWTLRTGSGDETGILMAELARAIAGGMVSLEVRS